jgi:Protein of unknown function (DUF3551)
MRALLCVAGILAVAGAITGAMSTPAQAQNYPWCAYYGGMMGGGGTNCGFTTFEQCMATVSGIGGFCDRNTQYVAPAGPHPSVRRRRRHPE